MRIRCVIDRVVLHDMQLSHAERRRLEAALREAIAASLRGQIRNGATAIDSPQPLRLSPTPSGAEIGVALGHAVAQQISASPQMKIIAGTARTAGGKR